MLSPFLQTRLVLGFLAFALSASLHALDVVPLPEGLKTQWDAVPVENDGGEHETMVINGLWRFQPGNPDVPVAEARPDDQWSHTWVPGSWHSRPHWNETGLVVDGTTALWKRYIEKHREWPIGWYEREITVPESWDGRAVYVNFSEISTRAQVWLDGAFCGALEKTHGRVELTPHLKAGEPQTLRVQVLAVPPSEPILVLMGEKTEQVLLKPAKLAKFGLVWDVELVSEPYGPNLEDLRLVTSVSEGSFSITGGLASDEDLGEIELSVQVEDMSGEPIKSWEPKVIATTDNTFSWKVDWLADRLWDIDDPYLMNARIRASGKGWSDERLVRFGFREFEVRGRDFILNGVPVRMRTLPHIDMPEIDEVVERWVRGVKDLGFNMLMIHHGNAPEVMLDAADRYGILAFAEVPEIKDYAVRGTWQENRESWKERMAESVTYQFNHPSIVMWWSGFNVFAHGEDQNPARIGQSAEMMVSNHEWEKRLAVGLDAMDLIRAEDSTRGVYSHNGSIVGDIQTTNVYMNLIPLQEREEWLSDWAENGDMPFLACEFGTPLDCTFMQGKSGGGWTTISHGKNAKGAANSAMMMTEYLAIYFGAEAYEKQEPEYASDIRRSHTDGFVHRNTGLGGWDSRDRQPIVGMIESELYQDLQSLYNTNTFRSWRTWGMTGGVNPWNFTRNTYKVRTWRSNIDNMSMGAFQPGTRGKYRPEISETLYNNYGEGGWEPLPSRDSLVLNNQDLLAWIGGDAEQGFTDKDHQFFSGSSLAKQAILVSDMRDDVNFEGNWTVEVAGQNVGQGEFSEVVAPASQLFVPFQVDLPRVDAETEGTVHLSVVVADQTLTDTFTFRVYPQSIPSSGSSKNNTVMLIEGDGSTRQWLDLIGSSVEEWDGASELPLVIGRGALEQGRVNLHELKEWVSAGGVVMISSPTPSWLNETIGFRVTPRPSRRAYPAAQSHSLTEGFDAEDLRDWNATSTTIHGYPEYSSVLSISGDKPLHGWRWGNRGSVASSMIEKPHHSGWRAIFEGEFDLAYSPLMQLDYGKGRVLLSTFDLEDNVAATPAAYELAERLVGYLAESHGAASPKGSVAYLGANEWEEKLSRQMGVSLAEDIDAAQVVVLGVEHSLEDSEIEGILRSGRNVLMLREARLPEFSGWSWIATAEQFYGSTEVPAWPEASALSYSDFHTRAPYAYWRIEGEGTDAAGFIARREVGDGVLMATSFDPTLIDVAAEPFMRLTTWRHSRNIASLISGLGGALELDSQIFDQRLLPTGKLPLAGEWKIKWIDALPAAKSLSKKYSDAGPSQAALEAMMESPNESNGWLPYVVPSDADDTYPPGEQVDGEFVLQKEIYVPEDWTSEDLNLYLARVDDHDLTYWNGFEVGSTGAETKNSWSFERNYTIPKEMVKPGKNTISIRVMDLFGGSGITSREHNAALILPSDPNLKLYHPDYRLDFAYGDDPYRYYRW